MAKNEGVVEMTEGEARKALAAAEAKFMEAKKLVNKQIKKNPNQSALIATGVGAAIGAALAFALTRRKK